MAIEYRLARWSDLPEVETAFAAAIDDLDKRHGFFSGPTQTTPANPQYPFWLEKNPHSFWVAEYQGKVIGYSFSFLRGYLWFLADLFIDPKYQGRGIGGTLIRKTQGSWQGHRISNRALITPAFNRASVSLYMRHGMYPRQPIYFATAPRKKVLESRPTDGTRIEVEEVSVRDRSLNQLGQIHKTAMGFPAGWHNEYFYRVQKAKCLLFKTKGRPVGYSFIRKNGRIGPLMVASPGLFRRAMETTLNIAAKSADGDLTIFFPGTNEEAVRSSIDNGFSITYPLLFLSSIPMGNFDNYLFYSPGLM